MARETPQLKDLLTVVYRPLETMRRILDARERWAAEVVVLACVCSSVADKDYRGLQELLPGIGLTSTMAAVALAIIIGCIIWVLGVYLFAGMVAFFGMRMGGIGTYKDVRAAVSWGFVPLIWSVLYRIPVAIYTPHLSDPQAAGHAQVLAEFIKQGGCGLAIVVLTVQIAFLIWVTFVESSCVAEALHLSTAAGLAAVAAAAAAPVVIGIAAALALKT